MSSSVAIDDLDHRGFNPAPHEANPPPIVDADAVLPGAITFQDFKTVARRDAEIVESLRRVEHLQLHSGPTLEVAGYAPDLVAGE